MTSPIGISDIDHASQSVCRRSTPVERRSRRRIATMLAISVPSIPSQSGTQIHSRNDGWPTLRHRVGHRRERRVEGLVVEHRDADERDEAERSRSPATQRQRRVSSRPFGKTSATATGHTNRKGQIDRPTCSDQPWSGMRSSARDVKNAPTRRIQAIGLRGWRIAISNPT